MNEEEIRALMAQIEASILEEENDAQKYNDMSKIAPPNYASILYDIGREEMTHRKHLMFILTDMKKMLPDGADLEETM